MNKYEEIAKKYISGSRLTHSFETAKEAQKLCLLYGEDEALGYAAGLVHDIAKPLENPVELANSYGLEVPPIVLANPALLHGPLGAAILREDEGITDEKLLRAVALHTTGQQNMTLFEKIIYIADLTEVGRDYEGIDEIRQKSYEDIDFSLILAFNYVMRYVLKRGLVLHPSTVDAYNHFIMRRKNEIHG